MKKKNLPDNQRNAHHKKFTGISWNTVLTFHLFMALSITAYSDGRNEAYVSDPLPGSEITPITTDESGESCPDCAKPLTDEQKAWERANVRIVKRVRLNDIGYKRIGEHVVLKKLRLDGLARVNIARRGDEIAEAYRAEDLPPSPGISSDMPAEALPVFVDNEKEKYFPKIRSQRWNSCCYWAAIYYHMTNEYALVHDIDVKSLDLDATFSPYFGYSMRVGTNTGSSRLRAFQYAEQFGAFTWNEYGKISYSYLPTDPATWRKALHRRIEEQYALDKNDRNTIKTLLLNGHTITISTYYSSWVFQSPEDNPSSTDDDYYVRNTDYEGIRAINGRLGGHCITVAGYNDAVWIDMDGDNNMDSSEVGAYLIVNSSLRHDKVFMPYTLFEDEKQGAGSPRYATVKANYEPKVIARFSFSTSNRGRFKMMYGVSDNSSTTPEQEEKAFFRGDYSFDGTIFWDFTDMLDGKFNRYYIGAKILSGSSATSRSMKLYTVEDGRDELAGSAKELPVSLDDEYYWAYVDLFLPGFPGIASNPSPHDDEKAVSVDVDLKWSAGTDATSHIVYFGTDITPDDGENMGTHTTARFDPGPLQPAKNYYWRVDEVNEHGITRGAVWKFRTGDDAVGPTAASVTVSSAPRLSCAGGRIVLYSGSHEGLPASIRIVDPRGRSLLRSVIRESAPVDIIPLPSHAHGTAIVTMRIGNTRLHKTITVMEHER